jgi:DNA-binding CsgD family transcriptional regulator
MENNSPENRNDLIGLLYHEFPAGSDGSRAWLDRLASYTSAEPALLHRSMLELRGALQTTIEYLPVACLLLTRDQTIRVMNARARRLIDAHLSLTLNHNRLAVVFPEVASRLKNAIQECMDGGNNAVGQSSKSFITLPRPNRLPLIFWVAPFKSACLPAPVTGGEWVALFFHDPEYKIPLSEDYLRETYGMTRAEAKVAVFLATGHAIDEIAETTGTTVNAVKFHLKALYAKTGTHRQSELVARILPSAVLGCYEFH